MRFLQGAARCDGGGVLVLVHIFAYALHIATHIGA